ncbi:glycoside hydrolase/phage tail family protein [Oceanicola sp. 502str15]|uniref:baseplate multidomain protein megatron n=1 Tax=Oceanicola sp. 502str15 TaxID=2696061 RepID=UPI002094EF7B|nr:glycoside hydrolase/phage tail family protein [Oceanicola sp. 502str15]MCO6381890.1 host specificity protein [Oceanicola sp. 502str15]
MATILLSAAGAALGSSLGGTFLGLSGAVIGRAVGATLGRVIDQRLMGQGSQVVEAGKVERFRVTGASEGAPIGQVFGRMRVGGQVIWATQFKEHVSEESTGGKGAPKGPTVRSYSYSISLAVALCEGEISRVGRVWADGVEIAPDDLTMRVYAGTEDQLPDPKMEAVEGAGQVPSYRGLAYVVIEDLQLGEFGNRVPQLSFEVVRPVSAEVDTPEARSLSRVVKAVALVPGTGEYALATTPVHYDFGQGHSQSANVNSPSGKTDFAVSLETLGDELPACGSVSLVVSWFGSDLRCGSCEVRPKVEQAIHDGKPMPWRVSGLSRGAAGQTPRDAEDRPIYGGTPADAAVLEAIAAMKAAGQEVVFYPFILMDQLEGNGLPDPWSGASDQPKLPWRGRITQSIAAGRDGSPDGTAAAEAEVAAFFGTASAGDFLVAGGVVSYGGPEEWSFRRFILHYAHLCAAAGGVEAFCLGSEMRGLTQIRGASGFPAVAEMRALAAELRGILGAGCKIGYAADWSEYFGYHPQDGSGNVYFHLDPLWADANIDFIGIDNYMPISDWRDGESHADAGAGAIYDLDYLKGNVAGGEGYDWYYAHDAARKAQIRTPITDEAHGEPWIYRYKDLKSWWQNVHHERIGGQRQAAPTDWLPEAKPIWFTELGCAAIDKGTNQPNKFLDAKSSESGLPHFSDGTRDDLIQAQYLRAVAAHFDEVGNNPVSATYGGPMVDMSRAHVWAWDARPFPYFPAALEVWSDGDNYARGHWLNGRVTSEALPAVVAELCLRSGLSLEALDLRRLFGLVRGYTVSDLQGARAALQPLMLAFGFDAVEREGTLRFASRTGLTGGQISRDTLAVTDDLDADITLLRAPAAETAGKVRLNYVENNGAYEVRAAEAIFPDEVSYAVAQSELPLALTKSEAQGIVERWLAESRVARDTARFALPPSMLSIGAGDVITLPTEDRMADYRVDKVEQAGSQIIDAVRVEPSVYTPSDAIEDPATLVPFVPPLPVYPLFLDLPLMTGDEVPHAPHVAASAVPWPGSVAVYASATGAEYELNRLISARATIGETETVLVAGRPGQWERGEPLRVRLAAGVLSSASEAQVFAGRNAMAIGDGSAGNWEIFQFATAELVAERTYEVSARLRGQLGTDGLMPQAWPVGSQVVLLDGNLTQIELASAARRLSRTYRIGPAGRAFSDPSYVERQEAFDGNGLRPYAPVHITGRRDETGDLQITWVRRTRIDGDGWDVPEVPLGEASEAYVVRVVQGGAVIRETTVSSPGWTYGAAVQSGDGVTGAFELHVAQISERFGPGLFGKGEING